MKTPRRVNVHVAKTQLSRLLVEVEHGHEIIVARNGTPVAKLVPFPRAPRARPLGQGRGQIWIAPDFDAPLPADELKRWGF